MSVISKVISHEIVGHQLVLITWATITCGDTGEPHQIPDWIDQIYFQATGTFNSQTLTFQGSNDGTTYFSLVGPDSTTALSLTSAGAKPCTHLPRYVRPSHAGTTGGDVDVTMLLRKIRN